MTLADVSKLGLKGLDSPCPYAIKSLYHCCGDSVGSTTCLDNSSQVRDNAKVLPVELVIDNHRRLTQASCECSHYIRNRLYS